ncbi:patched domain-containing protein 3-like isoform X2 [Dreissena polymorpha]|uniref:SSD domain-containing protein n=2 Tax=Dreissena polymorpha TaxID=45954 RepID=A0A9D4JG74_DREPO|nr:patched domain-containing protein 3-like isoform X2 [Dreissena polymorpha]XP_052215265.1 patched domain-containing protein 3-like isoform X2 [Dreissena polymorpha]XP_052215266.1 patched domain-containing protein 3-like isoform X2 [Dreissena polymorpha]KAH3806527.1 hypothetical protein DPMN_134850 [Dreissena polymorpha]
MNRSASVDSGSRVPRVGGDAGVMPNQPVVQDPSMPLMPQQEEVNKRLYAWDTSGLIKSKMNLMIFYESVEKKIGDVFARYGGFISRHAWKVIIIVVVINCALAVGMLRLKKNISAQDVYLPEGTRSREDHATMEATFPDLSNRNYHSIQSLSEGFYARVIVQAKSGDLLTLNALDKVKDLDKLVQNITVTHNGTTFTFKDLCAKAYGACALGGSIFWDADFLSAVGNRKVTYPMFRSSAVGMVNYASLAGGNVKVANGVLTGLEYIHLMYSLKANSGKELAALWVKAFKTRMDGYSSMELDVAYANHLSLNEELDKNISGDIGLFSITITLMLTYACFATMNIRDAVNQRALLGLAGILAAGLAIIASLGLCMAAGLEFVSIVGVMPFLIIGVGIDDMFILLSGLSGAQRETSEGEPTVEDRMKETMRAAGVGVTITSLTNVIAFMSGAWSSFLAVRNFCIYTGVAVVFCYINNITFFTACLAINERRVEANRHFLLMTKTVLSTKEATQRGLSKARILCCAGSRPTNRKEAESLLDKLPSWLIPKIVLKTPFKIGIILLFAGYIGASVYGCVYLKQGLLFSQLVSEKSYYHKYSQLLENKFSRHRVVSIVTIHTYSYSDASTESDLKAVLAKAKSNSYFDPNFEINWLSSYKSSAFYQNSSEVNFISGLKTFLKAAQYSRFENDVVIDSGGTSIKASRVYLMSRNLKDSQEEGTFMLESRVLADAAEFKCFAYSPFFISFEQYILILPQTLQTTGIALAAVFVATCIFMPHPVLIIFVTIAVTMIMAGVVGFLYYLDVALSSITMIHLIMSIGFSIDFTAHICHGFLTSSGQNRDDKIRGAIDKTGAPIFHGAVSSVLGIIVLVAAKSYIFRSFAFVMGLVLFFGITHALLLLPVVLSWIGPMSSEDTNVERLRPRNATDRQMNITHETAVCL